MSNLPKTIVVGMSGGVDSSVAAALLKEAGHNVIGIFMKNWEEKDANGVCQSTKDYEDVARVCEKLEIPYYSVEFINEYRDNVFKHFLDEYAAGHTPNPDILCNREIKFKVFYEKAMELGADYLATGHYCQKVNIDGRHRLVKGLDPLKDQSYFLYTLREEVLNNVLFPLGNMTKTRVRELAQQYDLSTKDKKDSTGICFIGERNFKNFLSQYLEIKPGNFEGLNGEVLGRHSGVAYYTNGQRKGLGLGGPGEPWYVVGKDVSRNVVIVERGDGHPALYAGELWANELTWVSGIAPQFPLQCYAKIRYRQTDQECVIESIGSDGVAHITFPENQRAITLRQSIVLYTDILGHRVCLGGGMISKIGDSLYQQQLGNKDLALTNCVDH
jgi:tRNA-uridine 2-sulfurtransferase